MKFFANTDDPELRSLSEEKRTFFCRALPIAQRIQGQTQLKALDASIRSPFGVFTSLIAADMIVASDWGAHPLAQPKYAGRISGNNLNLSLSNSWWEKDRPSILINGLKYKCYLSIEEFANNQSDEFAYSGQFDNLLESKDLNYQIGFLSSFRSHIPNWKFQVQALIPQFKLNEYDHNVLRID